MAQHGKFKGDGQAFLSTLQALRPEVKSSAPVRWVLKLQVRVIWVERRLSNSGQGLSPGAWAPESQTAHACLRLSTPHVQQAFAANDWIKFFALVDAAPYLLACLAHIYFNQVGGAEEWAIPAG